MIVIAVAVSAFFFKSTRLSSRIRRAEDAFAEEDYTRAGEIVKDILDKNHDYPPARYLKARLLIHQNQYVMAIYELNSILTLPDFRTYASEYELRSQLAHLYSETKNWDKEIEEYKMILMIQPDDVNANYRLGHALYSMKNYHSAFTYLQKSFEADPTKTENLLPLGVCYFHVGDHEKSELNLLRALETGNAGEEARFYLGSIYFSKKKYEEAAALLEISRKDRRYFVKSLFLLAKIFYEQENYERAVEILEEGLGNLKEKTDEAYEYRYLLAECYEMLNRLKEAIHHWEKIYSDNPSYRAVKVKLDTYNAILQDDTLTMVYQSSIEELQPLIVEMISGLQYNIIARERINSNEYQYRAFNIKRINEPPILIYFNRSIREITENQIAQFQDKLNSEKCRSGIYITTNKYSLRAKATAASRQIELYDRELVSRVLEKTRIKKKYQTGRGN